MVRKYRLWPWRARVGTNGYAVLYPLPARRPLPAQRSRPLSVRAPQTRSAARSRSRARAAYRRRRVLTVLFGAVTISALVALVTGAAAAWWVVVALLPLVCAYLAVLFRTRRLMAEREINVAFSGGATRTDATLEELFPGRSDHLADELGAVGSGRY